MLRSATAGAALLLAAVMPAAAQKSLAQKYLDGEAKLSTPFNYDGPAITLRYSTFLGKAGATPELYEKLWARLKADTNGKITVQPFWSNSLADAQTGGFESVASGIADMGTCYTQLNPGGFDLHFGVQLPKMFSDSSTGSLVFNEVYAKYLRDVFEKRNVYLARVGLTPPQQLLSKEPIRTFDEMKGKRAWSVGKVANAAVASLALAPTSLKISELYPGFQSGVIDVAPMHDAGAPLFRLTEPVKAYLYHWFQVWTQVESQLYYDLEAGRAREGMQKQGIQFIEFSDADRAKVDAAYAGVVEAWVKEQEDAGRKGRAMVEEMRALRTKYGAMTLDQRMQAVLDKPLPGLMPGR
jgi:TRAP-type C4-dicarboxylate transport system substrate-binding protein